MDRWIEHGCLFVVNWRGILSMYLLHDSGHLIIQLIFLP